MSSPLFTFPCSAMTSIPSTCETELIEPGHHANDPAEPRVQVDEASRMADQAGRSHDRRRLRSSASAVAARRFARIALKSASAAKLARVDVRKAR